MAKFKFNLVPHEVEKINTPNRRIQTLLPHPEAIVMLQELNKYESRSMHGQMPVVWDKAVDYQVFDPWGNIWIDFTSTIFVANAGHANPRIKKALQDIIEQDLLHSYSYPTKIRVDFLRELINSTPDNFEKAYLMSTGTEATECLIKLSRMHGKKIGKKKLGIVSFQGSYHGRTIGAASIGGNTESQEWIGYKDPNVYQVPFPYSWNIDTDKAADIFHQHLDMIQQSGINPKTDICGFILESYIGWAAAFMPTGYMQELAKFCKNNNILLSFDEVQGGFGRTGKMFVYQHYGVTPDLIACGKGISSSLPLSAVLGSAAVLDLPDVGSMSSTHSANPLACAAGLANLKSINQDNLVEASASKGKILHNWLNRLKDKSNGYIKTITGAGLLAAIIFQDPETLMPESNLPSRVCEKSMQAGLLLVHTGRESIKIAPPLTITVAALEEGLTVLEEILLAEINALSINKCN